MGHGILRVTCVIPIASLLATGGSPLCAQTENKPETVAKAYQIAVLQRDYARASKLLHPKVLKEARDLIMEGYAKFQKDDEKKGYIEGIGAELSEEEFENLSPEEMFVVLNRGRDKRGSPEIQFRDQTSIKVISVRVTNSKIAIVVLKVMPPSEELDLSFNCGLELQLLGSDWKVLRDVPELSTRPAGLTSRSTRTRLRRAG